MKKITIMILSAAVVAITVLGTLLALTIKDKKSFERYVYERAHVQASDAAEKLAASLDAAHASFLPSDISDVKRYSELLAIKLSELSLNGERTVKMQRYLSLVGEISQNSLRVIDEGGQSGFYRDLFLKFSAYAHRLDDEFLPAVGKGDEYGVLDDIFLDLGEIYYDGVYSDETKGETFSLLKNASILTEDEVKEQVTDIFGKNVKFSSTFVHSFPTVYNFSCENVSLDISQMGGFVLRMLYDHRPTGTECTEEEAKKAMTDFLSARGLDELILIDFVLRGDYFGTFAPICSDILCLSESVKLCVGKDNGEVIAYDAEDYYKYHKKERDTSVINVPDGAKLVYMIASNGRETLCYELDGEYYNAENGRRETKIY